MNSNTIPAIFFCFLRLGCLAFGGPVAHLAYFQEEFVRRRNWLTPQEYADLIALCQFLPGPASTQVAFAIGLKRGGKPGAFAAWAGFSLPALILMTGFALGLPVLMAAGATGWIAGLKLAAVAVVANAVWTMAGSLCPDRPRWLIALAALALLLLRKGAAWQVVAIAGGGLLGWLWFRRRLPEPSPEPPCPPKRPGLAFLAVFGVLLLAMPLWEPFLAARGLPGLSGFYRTGSLVFGGGHVMLPLLEEVVVPPGWVDHDTFLAGYGAAQAVPGPMFSFTAFLGARMQAGPGGVSGAALAVFAFILPSWLLVLGVMPSWHRLRRLPAARAVLMGANAAVLGLLAAAFYNPICLTALTSPWRAAVALSAFLLLRLARLPVWALVPLCALVGGLFLA